MTLLFHFEQECFIGWLYVCLFYFMLIYSVVRYSVCVCLCADSLLLQLPESLMEECTKTKFQSMISDFKEQVL